MASRIALLISVCFVVAALAGMQRPLSAMEVVHFNAAVLPPTPFKERQAKAQGKELKVEPGQPLWGHLGKPDGPGPFPAVVMMHGCAGIHPTHARWAELLNEAGYVTLVLDSFRPRSIFNVCAKAPDLDLPLKRVFDAYGALAYLQAQPYVDPDRIGLIGWSHGGVAALEAVHDEAITAPLPQRFKAAIAFYPLCPTYHRYQLPLLILIGEADDWTPAKLCRVLQARNGSSLDLMVYPDAYHSFDVVELKGGLSVPGTYSQPRWLKYDGQAHRDATQRVKAFLAKHLSAQ